MSTRADGAVLASEEVAEKPQSNQEKSANKGFPAGPPLVRLRPAGPCAKIDIVRVEITRDLLNLLSRITKDEPLLEYAGVAAALNVCLHRYTKLHSIATGAPMPRSAEGRVDPGHVIVLANEINGDMTFRQLLLATRQNVLHAYASNAGSGQSLNDSGREKAPNRCPLFDVALVVPSFHFPMPEVHHDVTLLFHRDKVAWLQASFSAELYDRDLIEGFCHHILNVLHHGLENTNCRISELPMLSDGEKQRLITEWNNTAIAHGGKFIHELFEEHARNQPDKTALIYGERRLNYGELDAQANKIANHLQRLGVGPDTLIGVFLNRSIELVAGILGILKAGAAYVPYDPTYPKERLATMFEDLKPRAVLTTEKLSHRIPDAKLKAICIDSDNEEIARESATRPPSQPQPNHLCYVIFTSGSTGRAKAAAVYHGGWSNLLNWFVREFNISPADRTLVMSSISFDITQRAMAMPLTSGGELHLLPSDHYEPDLILSTIRKEQITLVNCAPSTFYPLIEEPEAGRRQDSLRSLRCLFLGGEAISASRLKNWANSSKCAARIVNVYGAAECSDVSSFHILRDFDRYVESSVPAGRPIYNTQIYLLDEETQLTPIGVPGEICLAGEGVGKGYINDASLTATKFPENPFARTPGTRLYRTGDVGRYLPDGTLEFMGRVDNQVKIRGQRVELGEIETVLRLHPGISEAVVIQAPFTNDHQRLIAYVMPKQTIHTCGRDGLIDELRAHIGSKLPLYMVPNAFVIMDEMPLNPNGKIDRGALPAAGIARSRTTSALPSTPTGQVLAKFYTKLLGIDSVGTDDNFFDLGGHSLLVTQILALIGEEFKIQIQAADFYREPTISGLATRIDRQLGNAHSAVAAS